MALAEKALNQAMGRVLAGYRGELHWSQQAMGNLLGVGQRTISDIEGGRRGMTAADIVTWPERLATVLPYEEQSIRDRFLASPHLWLVEDEPAAHNKGVSSDTGASNLYSTQPPSDLGFRALEAA